MRTDLWPIDRVERLKQMVLDGMSLTLIGRELGIGRGAISGKLGRLGIKSNGDFLAGMRRREEERAPRPEGFKERTKGKHEPGASSSVLNAIRRRNADGCALPPSEPKQPTPMTPQIVTVTGRPWITRQPGECKFPVGGIGEGVLSCCAPVERAGYCGFHAMIAFLPTMTAKDGRAILASLEPAA